MNNTYKYTHQINYSEIESRAKMRLDCVSAHFQQATTFHAKEMGIDGENTVNKSNAYWVLSRIKLKLFEVPSLYDLIEVETFPTSVSAVRFNRDYKLNKDGKCLICGTSEWCCLDKDTLAIRRTDSICYPKDLEHRVDRSGAGEFLKVRESVEEKDFNHIEYSRFCDIDSNNHTNNVSYVKMALNCFNPREYQSLNVDEIEITYNAQTYFGDEIAIYKKQTDYGYYIEGICRDKKTFTLTIKVVK